MTDPLVLLFNVVVVVFVVVFALWVVTKLLTVAKVEEPFYTLAYVLVAILLAIWALHYLNVPGMPIWRRS